MTQVFHSYCAGEHTRSQVFYDTRSREKPLQDDSGTVNNLLNVSDTSSYAKTTTLLQKTKPHIKAIGSLLSTPKRNNKQLNCKNIHHILLTLIIYKECQYKPNTKISSQNKYSISSKYKQQIN